MTYLRPRYPGLSNIVRILRVNLKAQLPSSIVLYYIYYLERKHLYGYPVTPFLYMPSNVDQIQGPNRSVLPIYVIGVPVSPAPDTGAFDVGSTPYLPYVF